MPALLADVRLHADRLIREQESCADVVQSDEPMLVLRELRAPDADGDELF